MDTENGYTRITGSTDAILSHPPKPLTPWQPHDLAAIGRKLQADLSLHRKPNITEANATLVQALCVAEEAGELVKAFRRAAGLARSPGSRDDVIDEIADVLITTAVFAEMLGIDLNEAVSAKLKVIYSRGWGDDEADTEPAVTNDCAT